MLMPLNNNLSLAVASKFQRSLVSLAVLQYVVLHGPLAVEDYADFFQCDTWIYVSFVAFGDG